MSASVANNSISHNFYLKPSISSFISVITDDASSLLKLSNYFPNSIVSFKNYLLMLFYSCWKLFLRRGPLKVFCFS